MSHGRNASWDSMAGDEIEAIDREAIDPENRSAGGVTRFGPGRIVRRLSPRKLLIGIGLGLAVLMTGGFFGLRLVDRALVWLHGQPQHQVAFEAIVLEPPPPAWVRSSTSGLLREVHRQSRWRERDSVSIFDLEPEELETAFGLGSPWVKEARGVERRFPNRVIVRLAYREPVAWIRLGDETLGRDVVLDGDGVVLPSDDLNVQDSMPLVRLMIELSQDQSLDERVGLTLAEAPSVPGARRVELAREACRLAAFLKQRNALVGTGSNRSALRVKLIHQDARSGIWIETVEDALILWSPSAPRAGATNSNELKWSLIHEWLDRNRLEDVRPPLILHFEADGLKLSRST